MLLRAAEDGVISRVSLDHESMPSNSWEAAPCGSSPYRRTSQPPARA